MWISVAVALCLFGLTLAAEDSTNRKSRQILHPLVPVINDHHGHGVFTYVQQPQVLPQPHLLPQPHVVPQPHLLPQPVHYVAPSSLHVPALHVPQPFSFQPHLTANLLPASLHSRGPQVFQNQQNRQSQSTYSSNNGEYHHDNSGDYHHDPSGDYLPETYFQQFPQSQSQSSSRFGSQGNGFSQATPTLQSAGSQNNDGPSSQQSTSSGAQSQTFSQTQSAGMASDSSFQPLITPSQDEQQTFPSGSLMNQPGQSAQQSSSSQAQDTGLSAYRPSPRLYGPSPAIAQYPNQQSDNRQNQGFSGSQNVQDTSSSNSQNFQQVSSSNNQGFQASPASRSQSFQSSPSGSNQNFQQASSSSSQDFQSSSVSSSQNFQPSPASNSQRTSPSQTLAYFPFPPQQLMTSAQGNQQSSADNGLGTPILSQTGQISHDGSYSFGFHSANGIRTAESGSMRPEGHYRYVQGSYSYTAPDGTPISAQYYADQTGFHVLGDHIPTAPAPVQEEGSRSLQQPTGQYPTQPVPVESN